MPSKPFIAIDYHKIANTPAAKRLKALVDALETEEARIKAFRTLASQALVMGESLEGLGAGEEAERVILAVLNASPVDADQATAVALGCVDDETMQRVEAQKRAAMENRYGVIRKVEPVAEAE